MTEELTALPGMTDDEQALADSIYAAIQDYSRYDERGMQTAQYRVGLSDLGFCSERTRRMLAQEDPDDADLLPAFIGTAIGDHVERAISQRWPEAIIQPEVTAVLHGDTNTYRVPGHPDVVIPSGILIDGKTTRGLAIPRRTGPSQQQQFQRHCYALGAYHAGLFAPGVTLDDVRVANVWLDRAADERELHVHMEPYSAQVVEEATWWLDEVVYAFVHDGPARKEPPYEMCQKVCGFFATCRLGHSDAEGLLADDTVLAAVDLYNEGLALEKQGRQMKDQAKANLDGITGSTGEYTVRWTWVSPAHVEYDRNGYQKLDIRRVK